MKKVSILIILFFATNMVVAQSLVSMTPNAMVQGSSTIVSTITGSGTLFQNGSPPNSIVDVTLSGPATYNLFTGGGPPNGYLTVTDDEHADVDVSLPINAPVGIYSLSVTYYDCCPGFSTPITLTLPNAFTIIAPDGYAQGTIYKDYNQNNVKDAGEPGVSNIYVTANPGNRTVGTDASGNYSVPLLNGNYTITYNANSHNYLFLNSGSPNPINITIANANSTGNDFPVYNGLTSVNPDTAWLGQTVSFLVTSDKGIFRPSNVLVNSSSIIKITSPTYSIGPPQYTYIDTNKAVFKFNIPNLTNRLGTYSLRIYTNQPYAGTHILDSCIQIVNAPLYLTGTVFLDSDSNGTQGALEPGMANQKVLLTPDSTYAFTDSNGDYFLGTNAGTKTVQWVPGYNNYLAPNNPAQYTQTVSTTTGGFNFGLLTNYGNFGCDIDYWSGTPRCNSSGYWYGKVRNQGNNTFNGWVYVVKSANVSFGNSTPPVTYINGDTAAWSITNLLPFTTQTTNIVMNMPGVGSTYTSKLVFNAIDGSGNVQCSTQSGVTNGTVLCAFDPNDKAATPEGVYAQHYTLMGDTLDYLIRFQNTGNDTAFTVIVRDTIDADLDLNSFTLKGASHTMNTELNVATRVLKFTFNNILLPDSNVNEPESHGFIRYNIKAKTGLPNNTLVTNDADIYFDFNLPVITNETFNTMVYVIPVGISEIENNLFNVSVIPNPFENFASLKFDNEKHEQFMLNIFGIDGKLVETLSSTETTIRLTKEKMNSGLYLFELKNNVSDEVVRGKFVVK
ncbi:MAG TPA: hypothetical protein PKN75_10945 [Bacteroidia bacterium]|nr:hypothetical protein [Bacteroidia bacterium]